MSLLNKLTGVIAAALMMAAASTASARVTHAYFGTSWLGSQRASFDVIPHGVGFIGSGTAVWVTPLVLDNPGSKTISVTGSRHATATLACQAISLSPSGTVLGGSPATPIPATETPQTITLSLASGVVPAGAQVFVACTMTANAFVQAFSYNQ